MAESNVEWAARTMAGVDLGDERRVARAQRVLTRLLAAPAGSIPQQMQSAAETKAAYRLFSADDVTFEGLCVGTGVRPRKPRRRGRLCS